MSDFKVKKYRHIENGSVVEAVRFTEENKDDVLDWVPGTWNDDKLRIQGYYGVELVEIGNWVLKIGTRVFRCPDKKFQEFFKPCSEAELDSYPPGCDPNEDGGADDE